MPNLMCTKVLWRAIGGTYLTVVFRLNMLPAFGRSRLSLESRATDRHRHRASALLSPP